MGKLYSNGQKSSEGFYTKGEREKICSFWYENGQKKAEIDYFEGKKRIFSKWNEDGIEKELIHA